ncbi:MAG TPA: YunC family protein [Methanospirillum sp.]|uniref:YunC family protein n=1 Tax=Methanospirillum sp. TaxID=45200 RepID=UPI002CDD920A|nr:YunC family protein [Methanospirillum sp.]HOJ95509.1 YunC family protein [Methanospirillum sp.]HOL42095.1 YunC family protein [Methanospirillum sp.]HPP78693.1 YunC family protein [Methanospirillum sp.]
MEERVFSLNGHEITGYIIPIGDVNLVFARTPKGLVGCGAIDATALEKFKIPAVKVRPLTGDSIRNIEDLMKGCVAVVNSYAQELGITTEMNGEQALLALI